MRSSLLWFVVVAAVLAGCTAANPSPPAPSPPPEPTPVPAELYTGPPGSTMEPLEPLRGVPLDGPTGLRLLVGATVIDVDRGTKTRVAGMPDVPDDQIWVQQLGRDAVLTVTADCPECPQRDDVYVLPSGAQRATRIATGVHVTPGLGGLWAKRYRTDTDCTLAKLDLAGSVLLPERPIDCLVRPRLESRLGLHVWLGDPHDGAILDPTTLLQTVGDDDTIAVAGSQVIRWNGDDSLIVADRRFAIPEAISYSRPTALVSPDGRYVALEYGHPAWPGPRQRLDLWVLDVVTARWTQVPSMPVGCALKASVVTWSHDGRLLLYGWFEGAETALAVWRPGDKQLGIRRMDRPSSNVVVL